MIWEAANSMHVEKTEMNEPDLRGVDFFSPDLPMLDTLSARVFPLASDSYFTRTSLVPEVRVEISKGISIGE